MKRFKMIWSLIFNKKKFDQYWSKKICDEREKVIELLEKQFEDKLLLLSREKETKIISRDYKQPVLRFAVLLEPELIPYDLNSDLKSVGYKEVIFRDEKVRLIRASFVDYRLEIDQIKRYCYQEVSKYLVDNDFLDFNFIEIEGRSFVEVIINTYQR